MDPVFKFSPVGFSWVAIHPNPKSVIQFIGGALFGTFPTIFYRHFLRTLFEEGHTIIALPFRFSFRHWPIAIDLLKEQEILRYNLTEMANQLGYQSDIYQERANYFWLGHSLGCKYIALLEFLSGPHWKQIAAACVEKDVCQQIESILAQADLENASILGQPSLLIAPDISNTESAIPVPEFALFLDQVGLGVKPTREQTQCFIEGSKLFNLTALISFDKDTLAGSETDKFKCEKIKQNSDVLLLIEQLKARKFPVLLQELEGKHLEPMGIKVGDFIVDLNPFDKFIRALKHRRLEAVTIQFLNKLRERQRSLDIDLEIDLNTQNLDTQNNHPNPQRLESLATPKSRIQP